MAEADAVLELDVDTEDYATTAANDTPTASDRTAQSEADFAAQKASYTAKIENGQVSRCLRVFHHVTKQHMLRCDVRDWSRLSLHCEWQGHALFVILW